MGLVVVAACALLGCLSPHLVALDAGCTSATPAADLVGHGVDSVDLLVEIDNSGPMTRNQQLLLAQLQSLVAQLTTPALDSTGRPLDVPVRHLHVAVIDQDLGTGPYTVPGCENGSVGDDGLLNPIHFGQAEVHHLPTTGAPMDFRPASCSTDAAHYPSFISFDSGTTDATQFATDFQCNAALYINGCGLEQQLEAVWRALIWHDASDHMGNTDPNAGFLRDGALLAVLMLTDEEDMSVVDCRYARSGDPSCPGGVDPQHRLDVFDMASTAWASSDLNLRTYLYQPCGAQDPTWSLDRYFDPASTGNGLLSLKPGHPELVMFAAITGVPLAGDGFPTSADGSPNWDALLGTPSANGPNDFCGRDATATGIAVDRESLEGHVSMRQANPDPNCTGRTVPACRRQGTMDDPTMPACATTEQYFAWPARRIVEIARRFDQSTLCGGAACHNGLVASICGNDYTTAMQQVAAKIQSHLTGECLPRVLHQSAGADTTLSVDCLVREFVPIGSGPIPTDCSAPGRRASAGTPAFTVLSNGNQYHVCDITQLTTDPTTGAPSPGDGWYYDTHPADTACTQEIAFPPRAQPVTGALTRLACGPDRVCP